MASRQLGKALHINTPIAISDGSFKYMNDIEVGDIIFDGDGFPTCVVATTNIMQNNKCFEIEFDSGEIIIADADHLWLSNHEIVTTQQISENINKYCYVHSKSYINYIISIYEIEPQPVKCIQVQNPNGLYLCGETMIPTHNSTIAAAMLEWALNFFPGSKAMILNMQKEYAFENLDKIKFIHDNLPSYIKVPLKYKAERKTYIEYDHGSIVKVFYPSTTIKPDTIGRSLTVPILYIDEAGFISHIDKILGSAAYALSKAKEQAIKNNMPYFTFVTTTPNGIEGDGKWFYQLWSNGIDEDNIFNEEDRLIKNYNDILYNFKDKNPYIRIQYHWSEDPTKNDEWYNEQQRLVNFDRRRINQELDLKFLGGTNCIFEDNIIEQLKPVKPISKYNIHLNLEMKFFQELSDVNYYIIGIDTAKSLTGDMCAIEIFDYYKFNQVAEFAGRLGSVTIYSECIIKLLKYIEQQIGKRFYLAIENNSLGNQIVETLENEYIDQLFNTKDDQTGFNTNTQTKKIMVPLIYDKIKNNPGCIKSSELISQLNTIERKPNGSISAKSGYYDDLFISSAMCAYCYEMTYAEVVPLLGLKDLKKFDTSIVNNTTRGITLEREIMKQKEVAQSIVSIYSSEKQLLEEADYENDNDEVDLDQGKIPFVFL